jgi:hypothetical protein
MENCPRCKHPQHDGRRCFAAITKNVPLPHKGLILNRIETVANCACGMLDELIAVTGIDFEAIDPQPIYPT